jgi:pathogenesis-related protein 1
MLFLNFAAMNSSKLFLFCSLPMVFLVGCITISPSRSSSSPDAVPDVPPAQNSFPSNEFASTNAVDNTQANPNGPKPAGVTPADRVAILRGHNQARAAQGLAPLVWSDQLSAFAQNWADHLASRGGALQHRASSPYGENLYVGTDFGNGPERAVQVWLAEGSLYQGGAVTPSNLNAIGHYTQVMWSASTEVGCGIAYVNGRVIVVCNYNPPGNHIGQKPY